MSETIVSTSKEYEPDTTKNFEMQPVDPAQLLNDPSNKSGVQQAVKTESVADIHSAGGSSSQKIFLQWPLLGNGLRAPAPILPPSPAADQAQQPQEVTDDILDALNVDLAPVLTDIADLVPNSLLPHATVHENFHRCYAQLTDTRGAFEQQPDAHGGLVLLFRGEVRPRARSLSLYPRD